MIKVCLFFVVVRCIMNHNRIETSSRDCQLVQSFNRESRSLDRLSSEVNAQYTLTINSFEFNSNYYSKIEDDNVT